MTPWVENDHRQARRGQGTHPRVLQAAGSFQHHQGGMTGLHPVHAGHHPTGIVGDGTPLPRGAQGHVQRGLGPSIPTQHGTALRRTSVCPTLRIRAPWHQTTGRARGVQDVTTPAPVSLDQG